MSWFDENGRDLPWRRTRDPWRILVSEVILQQIQVKRAELDIGDGKKILTTVEDRFEMLISAIRGEDHPMLDAVRSGKGNPTPDPFTRLLRALKGHDESMPREDDPAD